MMIDFKNGMMMCYVSASHLIPKKQHTRPIFVSKKSANGNPSVRTLKKLIFKHDSKYEAAVKNSNPGTNAQIQT